ncbi:MAG: TIGR00268 family protein, partial [Treponema sp.]|nr:TIGR00268 family protein [Treponema sp.]
MPELTGKYRRLTECIAAHGSAAVAFSGGVDSSFLCCAARDALGEQAFAITIVSPMLPKSEIDSARKVARQVGIQHIFIEENEIEEDVAANPR